MMLLVKLIDLFVGAVLFLFSKQRRHNPSVPLALGTIGTLALILVTLATVALPRAWYYVRTQEYTAELANASGLTARDPVYIAGVPAGQIDRITLAGDHVRVGFRLDSRQSLGDRTTATVRLRTVLGKRFFDIMPAGVAQPGSPTVIPLARTTVPYSLEDVGRKAIDAAAGVDQQALTQAMRTVSDSLPADNTDLRTALAGIGSASAVFADNGEKLDALLRVSRSLSDLFVEQNDNLVDTLSGTKAIVRSLTARRQALGQVVGNLSLVLDQLSTAYRDRQAEFGELITRLSAVTATLKNNAERIDQTLLKMPAAIRAITNATGNGNWADVNSPSIVMPDNLLCALNIQRECR